MLWWLLACRIDVRSWADDCSLRALQCTVGQQSPCAHVRVELDTVGIDDHLDLGMQGGEGGRVADVPDVAAHDGVNDGEVDAGEGAGLHKLAVYPPEARIFLAVCERHSLPRPGRRPERRTRR
eukprot:4276481-Prymnesium_polylepis.1